MDNVMRGVIVVGLAGLLAAGGPIGGVSQEVERVLAVCQDCHSGTGRDRVRALSHGDETSCRTCHHLGLTNDPATARANRLEACVGCHEDLQSAHTDVAGEGAPVCTACHVVHEDPSLVEDRSPVDDRCASCHLEPHALHAAGAEDPPACADCHAEHGSHDGPHVAMSEACGSCHVDAHPVHAGVEELSDCSECHEVPGPASGSPSEPVGPEGCVRCHEDKNPAHASVEPPTPSCLECHDFSVSGVVRPASAPATYLCESCHEDESSALHAGGHGADGGLEGSPAGAPTCTSCHVLHAPPTASAGDDRRTALLATVRCIGCHESESVVGPYALTPFVSASYGEDFHGATVRFLAEEGSTGTGDDVLLCSDCHGAHEVGLLDRSQIAEVCARCHEEAGEALAGAWLGHEPVGPRNATLVWLVRLFYLFLIPFMLGGLFLTIAFHLVDQRRKGARVREAEGVKRLVDRIRGRKVPEAEAVTRFTRLERLEHAGAMLTFVLLVITGLPQTRPDLGAAKWIIGAFGGIWSTRLIHRIVGFTFVALMVVHVVRAVSAAIRRRRLPAMVPTRRDFRDVVQTFRHYLFRAPLPKVGKFDFSQKFEYWGLFLGGLVMSGTGIVLVFPELVTQLLPGVVVAALRVMHGLEATFAVLVIVLWHSYGVILRPEIFPLDTTIFTGKMDVRRLKHEHALEYERLYPEGGSR